MMLKKKAELDVEKRKKRKRGTPHSRQPAAKTPRSKAQQAAGMRECNRSAQ